MRKFIEESVRTCTGSLKPSPSYIKGVGGGGGVGCAPEKCQIRCKSGLRGHF